MSRFNGLQPFRFERVQARQAPAAHHRAVFVPSACRGCQHLRGSDKCGWRWTPIVLTLSPVKIAFAPAIKHMAWASSE